MLVIFQGVFSVKISLACETKKCSSQALIVLLVLRLAFFSNLLPFIPSLPLSGGIFHWNLVRIGWQRH